MVSRHRRGRRLVGRFSHSRRSERPSKPTSFDSRVTGWNRGYLDGDIVPRVYEVTILKDLHGRLRIDRAAGGSLLGRLKVYHGPHGEEPNPYSTGVIKHKAHDTSPLPPRFLLVADFPPYQRSTVIAEAHTSAYQVMNPGGGSTGYWYGDAFARRGFVVLALDIGHRSDSPLYDDGHASSGDDPDHGNGPHPSMKPPRMGSSDWEEDGEGR